MSNKVLLKKSSVASKVPLTTDLDYGELALNYADGKLYFKNSSNVIKSFTLDDNVVTLAGTQTLTNKTLTSPTINGGALSGTFSGSATLSGAITLSNTTASTSTSTGALTIGGGLGVAGAIYADQIRLTNNGNGTNVYVGDDVRLGDINIANTLGIRGLQDSTKAYIVFGDSNGNAYIGRDGTNPITVYGGQFVVNGSINNGSAALQLTGYASKGGTGYHDFLSVTNTYGSATNPSKFFRMNSTGNLEIINSAYTTNILTLTDAGVFSVPQISAGGSTGTNGQVLSSTGSGLQWISVGGTGTVTSITAGTGLTGGTITGAGTIAVDTTVVATLSGTQTLTNKTISGASNTLTNIPNSALTNSSVTINGTAVSLGGSATVTATATNALTIGTGLTGTSYNGSSAVTIAIDSTVATLTGTQTLTNKTLTLPIIDNPKLGYTTIATAAGTTTLTVSSNYRQVFTGTTTQTVVMPVTSTLTAGWSVEIENNSSGNLTINSSGANLIGTVYPGTCAHVLCIGTTLTTAADWDFDYISFSAVTGTGNNVLSASPTFTGTLTASAITASSTITLSGSTTSTTSLGTNATTGTTSIGGTSQTGTITLGRSTAAQTVEIATGATTASTTKVVNIGANGVSGSITNINFGSAVSGATGTATFNNDVVVAGNLTVNGTTTTVNSTTVTVDDKNIELGSVTTPTNTTADGGGITLKGTTDKTFNWVNATGAWTSSEDLDLVTGKVYRIDGTTVLSSTGLGSGVTSSSLTSVGTITSGTWQGTAIANAYLANSSVTIGSTSVSLGSTATTLAGLTSVTSTSFVGALTGNASTATTLQTARTINGVSFDGSSNITVTTAGTGISVSGTTVSIDIATTVDKTTPQTLTNKSLSDSTTYFVDETDTTKKLQFQLSGITTSTTRTLTIPDVSGTIITSSDSGTVTNSMLFGLIANNKLANSTISGVSLGGSLNALTVGSGLSLSSGTTYDGSTALTISHADTSSASNLTASGRTYVTGLTFDTYGHVTGYTTGTETVTDNNTTYAISAEVATGGVNLRLTGSDSSTDDVKLAAGTNITLTRTDANTITIASTGGGSGSWKFKTANYTAVTGDSIIATTSGGSFTITLPATPSQGDSVTIADGANWQTNNLTVARNGSTIKGLSEDLIMDLAGAKIDFVYSGTTWLVFGFASGADDTLAVSLAIGDEF